MSRTDDPSRPRATSASLAMAAVLAAVMAALLTGLLGPAEPAVARPSPLSVASPTPTPERPTSPTPRDAVGAGACCTHPDPPRTAGVPYRWCVRHHTCWQARQFVTRQVHRFRHYRRDGVTHRILPRRFERNVRRLFAHRGCGARCARTGDVPAAKSSTSSDGRSARRDGGGYEDWVDDSDCVVHGYGCYFPANPGPSCRAWRRRSCGAVERSSLPCCPVAS